MGDRNKTMLTAATLTGEARATALRDLLAECTGRVGGESAGVAFGKAFKEGLQRQWLTSDDPQTCQLTESGRQRLARY